MRKKKNLKRLWPTAFYLPSVMSGGEPWYLSGGIAAANCLGAYKAIGAADIATSYINIARPGTNDLTTAAAPTFAAATGWTFNGTSQYLDTGIAPTVNSSMIIRYAGSEDVAEAAIIGEVAGNVNFYICPRTAANLAGFWHGTAAGAVKTTPKLLTGVLGIAGATGYRNGVAEAGTISGWSTGTPLSIYIGAYNAASITWAFVPSSTVQAVAIYSTTLTDPQMLAVYTAMAALA